MLPKTRQLTLVTGEILAALDLEPVGDIADQFPGNAHAQNEDFRTISQYPPLIQTLAGPDRQAIGQRRTNRRW